MSAAQIAAALGGVKRNGNGWLCRCPSHADRTPSLSICDWNGGVLLNCFAGCRGQDVRSAIQSKGFLLGEEGVCRKTRQVVPFTVKPLLDWSQKAQTIWDPALPLIGTVAEAYLEGRGCYVPNCDDLRCLPAHGRHKYPSLVARVTDAITGRPISLHFTSLNPDGTGKAPLPHAKNLLTGHRKVGGVIRLTDDADVISGLGIAEGIETALACMKFGWSPVWAAIDAGNLGNFPVIPGIDCLTIFSDNDPAGLRAAEKCAQRWQAAGRQARWYTPAKAGMDWNDVLRAQL